jgi:hypothetical protein
MRRLPLLCILCIAVLASNTSAVVIDDYQSGEYTLGREGSSPPYTVSGIQYDATGLHIIGGQRDVVLEKRSGSGTQPYCNVMAIDYNGVFGWSTYNSNFNCNASWTTTYGTGADLDANLTVGGATAILVDLVSGDMYSGPRPIPMTITIFSGGGSAAFTRQLVNEGTYDFPFSAFSGVDFTDVDRIVVEIVQDSSVNDAVDFALGQIYTNETLVGVDESTWGAIKNMYQ